MAPKLINQSKLKDFKIENEENSSPEVLDLIGIGWHEN